MVHEYRETEDRIQALGQRACDLGEIEDELDEIIEFEVLGNLDQCIGLIWLQQKMLFTSYIKCIPYVKSIKFSFTCDAPMAVYTKLEIQTLPLGLKYVYLGFKYQDHEYHS